MNGNEQAERNASKRARVEAALRHGPAQVRFDPRPSLVLVLEELRKSPTAVLAFSPRFDPPDLVVDDQGLRQTLSFAGKLVPCFVPWDLIWSVESEHDDGCGFFAPDVPAEQVEAFFHGMIEQRILLDRVSRALNAAIELFDTGAGSGPWRRWRDSLRQTMMPKRQGEPEKAARRLEVVKG